MENAAFGGMCAALRAAMWLSVDCTCMSEGWTERSWLGVGGGEETVLEGAGEGGVSGGVVTWLDGSGECGVVTAEGGGEREREGSAHTGV